MSSGGSFIDGLIMALRLINKTILNYNKNGLVNCIGYSSSVLRVTGLVSSMI
jgi:hypothetical protein